MAADGRSFSGEVGWVNTEMFWIENHMVAPKEQALTCNDCHTPNGRLDFAALGYPPERALTLQTMAGFNVKLSQKPAGWELIWIGTPGHSYQVQHASDPASAWMDAQGGKLNAGTSPAEMTWTDSSATGASARYYRVIRSGQ